ncbi:hypothetical protein E2C01_062813 [Portunus trituberculatus]|uniref:Uncharacterized protein n=1 Tax=Portunus trituberculatus TaxID=210409 RepID=A0A5B7H7J1_PORTR|nr:hypothetical protein [Portunus trituberculatus]
MNSNSACLAHFQKWLIDGGIDAGTVVAGGCKQVQLMLVNTVYCPSVSPLHNMAEPRGRDSLHEPGVLSGLSESLPYEIFTSSLNIFLSGVCAAPKSSRTVDGWILTIRVLKVKLNLELSI